MGGGTTFRGSMPAGPKKGPAKEKKRRLTGGVTKGATPCDAVFCEKRKP